MKLSFVIPAYNEEKNITDCILSIKSEIQKYGFNFKEGVEIIVVNNNSTDKTRELVLKQDVIVVDELRKGLPWARQAGIDASNGDLIANIDADNRLLDGWLETVYDYFSKNKNLVALSGPLIYYDTPYYVRLTQTISYVIGYSFNFILSLFNKGSMMQGGNFILRRDAILKIGGFDTSITFYAEDTDVGRRISKIGKNIWTFSLPINSSGRRIMQEGLLRSYTRYCISFLSIAFTKKSVLKEYKDYR